MRVAGTNCPKGIILRRHCCLRSLQVDCRKHSHAMVGCQRTDRQESKLIVFPAEKREAFDKRLTLDEAPGQCLYISRDRKSTRLNSSHMSISYAVFCLKKKKKTKQQPNART